MDEDIIIIDDDDTRNARVVRRPWGGGYDRPAPAPASNRPVTVVRPAAIVKPKPATLNTGDLVEAAAHALAAFQPLPTNLPRASGDPGTDFNNLVQWHQSLAQTFQRGLQIRTAGTLARVFLQYRAA